MPSSTNYVRYTFRGRSGYLIDPNHPGVNHDLVVLGHTASVPPWRDSEIHAHNDSEEYYFLRQGILEFLVADSSLTLRSQEILMVKPGFPHAIVGGEGPIEHFGIRAPALQDKDSLGEIPVQRSSLVDENERELRRD